jgi:carbon storage regulator CsrA
MLVLSLRVGQSVGVGNVQVRVEECRAGQVRLSFQGPREVPIVREAAKVKEAKP